MIKLVLIKVQDGCRLGTITSSGLYHDNKTVETPACLLYSQSGAVPHLTPEVLSTINSLPSIVHMGLPGLFYMHEALEKFQQGIGKFSGMEDNMTYLSIGDKGAVPPPSGYNTKTFVATWTHEGKSEVTVDKYMSFVEACKPNWFEALCDGDTCSPQTQNKRLKKSVDRSLKFLDDCLERYEASEVLKESNIFGVIEGGNSLTERLRSAKETAKRSTIAGFVIDGLQRSVYSQEVVNHILSAINEVLPEEKPRLLHGAGNPLDVLYSIERGIDLFDSTYPYLATQRHCALIFPNSFDESLNQEENNISSQKAGKQMLKIEIRLDDEQYAEDFTAILEGCQCYCCRNHTKAYLYHLVQTKELLAGVLLMMHNFHHYFEFFNCIRESLKKNKFKELKKAIFLCEN